MVGLMEVKFDSLKKRHGSLNLHIFETKKTETLLDRPSLLIYIATNIVKGRKKCTKENTGISNGYST